LNTNMNVTIQMFDIYISRGSVFDEVTSYEICGPLFSIDHLSLCYCYQALDMFSRHWQ